MVCASCTQSEWFLRFTTCANQSNLLNTLTAVLYRIESATLYYQMLRLPIFGVRGELVVFWAGKCFFSLSFSLICWISTKNHLNFGLMVSWIFFLHNVDKIDFELKCALKINFNFPPSARLSVFFQKKNNSYSKQEQWVQISTSKTEKKCTIVTMLHECTCILFNTKQETDIRKMKNGVVARSTKTTTSPCLSS